MRRILILLLLLPALTYPVSALELTAPQAPEAVQEYMPSEPENLSEGIAEVLRRAIGNIRPDLKEAAGVCSKIVAVSLMISLLQIFHGSTGNCAALAASLAIAASFLSSAGSLIRLGADTVTDISSYGKLLLPVMAAALSAQGGVTTASAVYAGTAFFDAVLAGLISKGLLPMLYVYLSVAVAGCALGEDLLKRFKDAIRGFITWSLKTVLYIFTGYVGITGVISGPTDAAALKAAKLTISGVVPVVGGILSDASEAILVSAGTVKNTIGMYGLFAVMAIWLEPFLKIGCHYLLLKLTASVCNIFAGKQICTLIDDFASVMGYLLAMTGAVCLMLLISTVCFMKGVN